MGLVVRVRMVVGMAVNRAEGRRGRRTEGGTTFSGLATGTVRERATQAGDHIALFVGADGHQPGTVVVLGSGRRTALLTPSVVAPVVVVPGDARDGIGRGVFGRRWREAEEMGTRVRRQAVDGGSAHVTGATVVRGRVVDAQMASGTTAAVVVRRFTSEGGTPSGTVRRMRHHRFRVRDPRMERRVEVRSAYLAAGHAA